MASAVTEANVPTEVDYTDFEHTGPGTLAGRYLRSFWQPIFIAEDLPPAWTKPIHILGEDFTLYRGETGTPHLVAFRCAHRGTQLSTGWVEDDCIRCRYHGWKYDAAGQCIEAPLEAFAPHLAIRTYPVEEYLGLIFAYLGDDEPCPFPRYPALEQEGMLDVHCFVRACNYFHELENDPGHVPFTHRSQLLDRQPGTPRGVFDTSHHQPDDIVSVETAWGITRYTFRPETGKAGVQHLHPNIHSSGSSLKWMVPIDDDSYISFLTEYVRVTGEAAARRIEAKQVWLEAGGKYADPDIINRVLAGEIRLEDLDVNHPETLNLTRVQDGATQLGQGKIRDKTQEHLGRADVFVVQLRKVYEREMRALAEGRSTKQWDHGAFFTALQNPAMIGTGPRRNWEQWKAVAV